MDDLEGKWEAIRAELRSLRGEAEYYTAIKQLQFAGFQDGTVKILAPTNFLYTWCKHYYSDLLLTLWQKADTRVERIELVKYQEHWHVVDGKIVVEKYL